MCDAYDRIPYLRHIKTTQTTTTWKNDHENDLRYTQIKQMKEDVVYQSVQDVSCSPCDHLRPYYALKEKVLIIMPRKKNLISYKN